MDSPAAAASDLAARMRVSVIRLTRPLSAQHADSGVTLTYLSAMATLYSGGPMTPGKLAAAERVRPPSVTGIDHLHADAAVTERWLHDRLSDLPEPDRETLTQAVNIIDRMAEA